MMCVNLAGSDHPTVNVLMPVEGSLDACCGHHHSTMALDKGNNTIRCLIAIVYSVTKKPWLPFPTLLGDYMPVAKKKAAVKKAAPDLILPFIGPKPRLSLPERKALDFLMLSENNSAYYEFEYGMFTEDAKKNSWGDTRACHAGMNRLVGKPGAVWSKMPRPRAGDPVSLKVILEWNDWLINQSPWHEVALPVSRKFASAKGFVCRVDKPANLMVNFLMATRMPCEHALHVKNWHKLVHAGVNPDMAFIIGCLIDSNLKLQPYGGFGHHPFENFGQELVENFVRHHVAKPSKNYDVDQEYKPCTAVWGNKHTGDYLEHICKTYPTKKPVKNNRTFCVPDNIYAQDQVSHTFDEWVEIANIEHKRILHVQEENKAQPRRGDKAKAA